MFSVSKRLALLGLLFSILTNQIVQTDKLEIFPKVENDEQVIEQGSTLTLTCIKDLSHNLIELRWTLPKFQTSLPAIFRHGRLNKITFRNETHLVSTMTLTNTTNDDTGFYNCSGNWEKEDRYVYVSSTENLSLMRNQNYIFPRFNLTATTRDSIFIHFITTHPNVTISIFKQTREIGVQPQKAFRKIFDSSSPTVNSRWSFHPRNGLTIKNPTVSDSSIYYVVSYLLRFVNGKRVDIKHDKTTDEFLSWIIPPDEINYSSVMQFSLIVEGMEIERVGAPVDPVEGSNVTLICTTSAYFHNVPPSWFYYDNGHHHQVTINTDVQIKTEREWKDLIFYKSQLYLTNVTLNSPYTKLKCGYDTENSTVKEISFTIKEIDNDPVSNSITLEKGTAQILTCNRVSQHVPIHWLKDGNQFSGTVDETETSSILQLKGKAKEVGIYECQWKNGRGEARHRNFNVTVTFVEEETNAMILSVTFIGLLAVGVGIGIKLYFDKTKTENQVEKILNGDPGEIDPNILIKTEFLPYDQIGEFTKKRLRLVLLFLDI